MLPTMTDGFIDIVQMLRHKTGGAASLSLYQIMDTAADELVALRTENAELKARLNGQTCYVPPEFQKALDEAQKTVAMLREALEDIKEIPSNKWLKQHDDEVARKAKIEVLEGFLSRHASGDLLGFDIPDTTIQAKINELKGE